MDIKSILACARDAATNLTDDQSVSEFNDILEENDLPRIQLPRIEYVWLLTYEGERHEDHIPSGIFATKQDIEQALRKEWDVLEDSETCFLHKEEDIHIEYSRGRNETEVPTITFHLVVGDMNQPDDLEYEDTVTAYRIPFNQYFHLYTN